MGIGISPLVDFAFKLMLGSPEHSSITVHFLNAILIDQAKICHVEILNPILGKESDDDKLSVLDILATDEHGRLLNIEMQTSLPSGLNQRLAYYASSLYAGQPDIRRNQPAFSGPRIHGSCRSAGNDLTNP